MGVHSKETLIKNIKIFKDKGYLDKLQKLYRKLPVTTCAGCGTCCTDSPVISYPEFLFVYEYFDSEFSKNEKIDVLKKAIREFMYGLVEKGQYCAFLNEDKKCMIYERSPISCKRWGLQSEKENNDDFQSDYESNKRYQAYYASLGIIISDEVVNSKLPFCEKVKEIKNTYKFSVYDFEQFTKKDLFKMMVTFGEQAQEDWSLCHYLVYTLLGKTLAKDRVVVIKEYQQGNINAVEEYISKIDFDAVF